MQGRELTLAVSMEAGRAAGASNFRLVVYYEFDMTLALERRFVTGYYGRGSEDIYEQLGKLPPWRRWLDEGVKIEQWGLRA